MTLREEEAAQELAVTTVEDWLKKVNPPSWLKKASGWILSKVFKIPVDKNNPEKTVEAIIARLQKEVGASDVTTADPQTESYKYHNAIGLLNEDWALEMDYIANNLDQIQEYVECYPEQVARMQEALFNKGLGKTILRMTIPILLMLAASYLGVPRLLVSFAMPLFGVIKAIGGSAKAAKVAQQAASPKVQQELQQTGTSSVQSQFLSKVTSEKWRQFFLGVPDSAALQQWAKEQSANPSVKNYIDLGVRLMKADLQNIKATMLPEPTQKQFSNSVQWLATL